MNVTEGAVLELEAGRGLGGDPARKGDWMQTWVGVQFYPEDPRRADVDIMDIAFALGNMTRYGGHCRFYSVAEHSVLVSRAVRPELALDGLMHDAAEAYLGDVVRPVKLALGRDNKYFELERKVRAVIAARYDLADEIPLDVQIADVRVGALEKKVLHPRSGRWDIPYAAADNVTIDCLPPQGATLAFLRRFCELTGEEYGIYEELHHRLVREDELAFGCSRMVR